MSENIGGGGNNNADFPANKPEDHELPEQAGEQAPVEQADEQVNGEPAPVEQGRPVAQDANATERIAPFNPTQPIPAEAQHAQQPYAAAPQNPAPQHPTAQYPAPRNPTPQRWQAPGQHVQPPQTQPTQQPGQPGPGNHSGANPTVPMAHANPAPVYGQNYGHVPDQAQDQHNGGTHADAGYPASNSYPHTLAPAVTARPKDRKKVGLGLFSASVVAAALIGGLAAGGVSVLLGSQNTGTASSSSQPAAPLVINNTASVNQVSAAAAKAMPSVVTISATSGSSGGTGSGIILDTEGHILTNTHVVTLDGAAAHATIQVQTSDGKVFAGSVVGTDPLSDLAIVKIDAPNLVPATLGDSSKTNVGDTVIAIGSPLGLNATVTEGIISTLNRTIQVASSAVPSTPSDTAPDQNGGNGFQFSPPGGGQSNPSAATGSVNLNVIQTDAAINPGNSGGALVDAQGKIIGVNVAIASAGSSSASGTQSGNIGVGFSIPIDHAKRIAQDIIANGSATHGQLGVSVSGTSALGAKSQFSAGATVADVTAGSAAAKAGLQKGDIVTGMAGLPISDASSLTAAVREQSGGATVKMTFTRDGKTMEKDVTLDTMSAAK